MRNAQNTRSLRGVLESAENKRHWFQEEELKTRVKSNSEWDGNSCSLQLDVQLKRQVKPQERHKTVAEHDKLSNLKKKIPQIPF